MNLILYNGAYNGPQIDAAISRALSGGEIDQRIGQVAALISAPTVAATAAAMTDTAKVYIYTGSEAGYNTGHWYYWDGAAWADGGAYQAAAADSAMSPTSENAVQNKVINAAIEAAKAEAFAAAYDAYPTATIEDAAMASFTDGADDIPPKTLIVNIDPVQAAGTPSPSDPLPVSGWTGANIERARKNILPIPQYATTTESGVTFTVAPDGSVSTSGTATADIVFYLYVTSEMWAFCRSLDGVQVSFSCCPPGGSTETYRVLLARLASSFISDTGDGATFTINARYDGLAQYITINIKSGTNTDGLVFRPVMTVGSSVPGFEPVNRNTFNVSWQTEAGTVYGGTLENNGDGTWTLNAEKVSVTVDGTTTAIVAFDNAMDTENAVACYFTASPALVKTNDYSGKILCDKMPPLSIAAARGGSPFTEYKDIIETMDCSVAGYRRGGQSGNNYLYFSFNTTSYPAFAGKVVADANAWFAANPVQVVYELATPISYTISNAESVRTLLGDNNIWSDTGNIAELTYRADPTLFVTGKINAVMAAIAEI